MVTEAQFRVICAENEDAPQFAYSLEEAWLKAAVRDQELDCGPHRVQKREVTYTNWETCSEAEASQGA